MQNSSPSPILCTRVSTNGCIRLCSLFKVLQSSCCNIAKDLILISVTLVLIRSISCSFTLHTAAGSNTESDITRQTGEKVRWLQHCGWHTGDSSIYTAKPRILQQLQKEMLHLTQKIIARAPNTRREGLCSTRDGAHSSMCRATMNTSANVFSAQRSWALLSNSWAIDSELPKGRGMH